MFIWTFLITKTQEITSCSYALKSWNTLYVYEQFAATFWCLLSFQHSSRVSLSLRQLSMAYNSEAFARFLWNLVQKLLCCSNILFCRQLLSQEEHFEITDVKGGSHVHNQVSTPGTEKAFPLSNYVIQLGNHPTSYTINRGAFTEA